MGLARRAFNFDRHNQTRILPCLDDMYIVDSKKDERSCALATAHAALLHGYVCCLDCFSGITYPCGASACVPV